MDIYVVEFSPTDMDGCLEGSVDEASWQNLLDDMILQQEIEELIIARYKELAGLVEDDGEIDDESDD